MGSHRHTSILSVQLILDTGNSVSESKIEQISHISWFQVVHINAVFVLLEEINDFVNSIIQIGGAAGVE